MTQLGTIAYNEGGLLLFGTLAMGWTFRAVVTPARRPGRFPIAGLMAGFACGSKLTAVPEILVAVGVISAVAILLGHRTRRVHSEAEPRIESGAPTEAEDVRVSAALRARLVETPVPLAMRLTGVATFVLAGLLAFAPWLIRNQLWAGNPVFPEAMSLLGRGHFSDAQVDRWKQAHAPRADQRSVAARLNAWRADVWASWQYGYGLLPLGVAAGVLTLLRKPASRADSDSDSNVRAGTSAADAAVGARSRQGRPPSPSPEAPDFQVLKNIRIAGFLLTSMFVALSAVWLGFTHLQGRFFVVGIPIAALLLAGMRWGRGAAIGAALVLIAAGVGFARLHGALAERLIERKMTVLLGYENIAEAFVPQAFDGVPQEAPVALVGDARAFVYPGPMNRLFYRTVFDVDAKPGETVIDAWRRGAPPDAWLLVDPIELGRFRNTYAGIPPLSAEYADRREPFVIPPKPGH
jgi:hypothetical protein